MNLNAKEQLSFKNSSIFMVAILLMAVITYYFFLLQQEYPPCCDAVSYAVIAAQTNSLGFLESQIPLRTFAYPLFLTGVEKISAISSINYALLVLRSRAGGQVGATIRSTSGRLRKRRV